MKLKLELEKLEITAMTYSVKNKFHKSIIRTEDKKTLKL